MSTETPPVAEPQKAPPEPQPGRFEDFMSDSIGAALKENPNMPNLEKDRGPEAAKPEAAPAAQPEIPPPAESKSVVDKPPEVKPPVAETPNLLPDFSKLTFGQEIATKIAEAKEKPAEIPTPDQFPEKLPGKVTPQVEQAFGSMRKANKALYEQNASLTGQLKEVQEKLKEFEGKMPMDKSEFERLSNERDTLVKDLRLVKLEATPEYKAAITRPMEQIDGEIKRLAGKYSVNEHQIRKALVEGDQDKQSDLLGQVTETFNDRDKLNLYKMADATLEIVQKKDILMKDVQQALNYIEAKRTAESEAKAEATKVDWNRSLSKAWDTVGEALYLARPMEGNEAWNNSLKEAKDLVAKTDVGAMDSINRAKVLVQAALLPRACMVIQQLWNMYSEAAKTVQRYQGAIPAAGGGNSGAGTEATVPKMPDETSFLDAVEARIKG